VLPSRVVDGRSNFRTYLVHACLYDRFATYSAAQKLKLFNLFCCSSEVVSTTYGNRSKAFGSFLGLAGIRCRACACEQNETGFVAVLIPRKLTRPHRFLDGRFEFVTNSLKGVGESYRLHLIIFTSRIGGDLNGGFSISGI
jgi:hypothetical protein